MRNPSAASTVPSAPSTGATAIIVGIPARARPWESARITSLGKGGDTVAVPRAFYAVVVAEDRQTGKAEAMGFLIGQDAQTCARLRRFLCSVDEIEAVTGLDFMPRLPDEAQRTLETFAQAGLAGPDAA